MQSLELTLFLDQLRGYGFQLGLDSYQHAHALAGKYSATRLKTLLCPLLAQNARQQEQFYELFDAYFQAPPPVRKNNKKPNKTPSGRIPPVQVPSNGMKRRLLTRRPRWLAWAFSIFLVIGVALGMYLYSYDQAPAESSVQPQDVHANGNQEINTDPSAEKLVLKYQNEIKFGLWSLMLLSLVLLEFSKSRKLVKARRQLQTPPFIPELKADDRGLALAFSGAKPLLRDWRRQIPGMRSFLDIRHSIYSTIRSGGFAQPVFCKQQRAVEYLFLLDLNTSNQHQIQLLDTLYGLLRENNVYVERYFYQGDPRACWNEGHKKGASLEEMFQRYPHHQLIMLGTGSFLLQAGEGARYCRRQLKQWENRALLSTRPSGSWSHQEAFLAKYFTLLPANKKGFLELASQLEGTSTQSTIDDWKTAPQAKQAIEVFSDKPESSLRQQSIGPAAGMAKWLAACALYPQLEWAVTIHLGEELSKDFPGLLSFDNLLLLNRITWFSQGEIPEHDRQWLVEGLSAEEEKRFRNCIIDVLRRNLPDNKNSGAYREQSLQIAKQEALLHPNNSRKQKALKRWQPHELKPDLTLKAVLEKSKNNIPAFLLPLLPYIYKDGLPFWGMRRQARRWLWTMALGLALLFFFGLPPAQPLFQIIETIALGTRPASGGVPPYPKEKIKKREMEKEEDVDGYIVDEEVETLASKIAKLREAGKAVFIINEDVDLEDAVFMPVTVEIAKEPGLKDVIVNLGMGINDRMLKLDESSSDESRYVFRGVLVKSRKESALVVTMMAHAAGRESQKFDLSLISGKRRVVF